jgi:hypothetical protein
MVPEPWVRTLSLKGTGRSVPLVYLGLDGGEGRSHWTVQLSCGARSTRGRRSQLRTGAGEEIDGIRLRSTGVRDRKIENLKLNGWSIWRSSEDVYSSLAVGLQTCGG